MFRSSQWSLMHSCFRDYLFFSIFGQCSVIGLFSRQNQGDMASPLNRFQMSLGSHSSLKIINRAGSATVWRLASARATLAG